jgi:two-component system, cell cycle response regulator
LSLIDDVTQLYKQSYLATVLDNEVNRSKRRNASFSVLFLDLDYFRMINDTRGHWVGSKLLTEVSKILKTSIRSCDYGFRYGGDEFIIVLPDTDIKGGQVVADRIRKAVEDARFLINGQEIRVTVSVGLAAFPDHAKTRDQIVQLADQAMYFGKRTSRNIVYVAS